MEIEEVDLRSLDLSLLQNLALPPMVLLSTYPLAEFDGAILYPKALRNQLQCTYGDVCKVCLKSLRAAKMPDNVIANFQYYAYYRLLNEVGEAFNTTSLFDLMLVVRARLTKISYMFNHKVGGANDTRQGFIRGNVTVLPQDTMRLCDVIPPAREKVHEALCTLFISSGCTATKQNVEHLSPVLVNKGVVHTLANFLVSHNPWYHGQVTVDEHNIEDLYDGSWENALSSMIEIACLNSETSLKEVDHY